MEYRPVRLETTSFSHLISGSGFVLAETSLGHSLLLCSETLLFFPHHLVFFDFWLTIKHFSLYTPSSPIALSPQKLHQAVLNTWTADAFCCHDSFFFYKSLPRTPRGMYMNGEPTAVLESFLADSTWVFLPRTYRNTEKGWDTPGLWGPVSLYPSSYQFSLGVKILIHSKRADRTCFKNERRNTLPSPLETGKLVGSSISGTWRSGRGIEVKPHVLFLSHLPGFPAQLNPREAGDGDPSVEGMGLPHCQRCDRRGCFWLWSPKASPAWGAPGSARLSGRCGAKVLVCAQMVQCSQSSEESHQTLSAAAVSLYVTSNSLRPHRLQHVGLPCPSPSPRVHSDSCPLSWWCYPTISSPATLFFYLQFPPVSGLPWSLRW